MPGQEVIHEAIKASWTIDKIGGILATSIVIIVILLSAGLIWIVKKLIVGFQRTNEDLLETNKEIARANQEQMSRLTDAVNNLANETRHDIASLRDDVDGLKGEIRDRQMMP